MSPALQTRGLCKNFGALRVAQEIDFELAPGARHALIGPNGAGKTTFVNMLTGRLRPSSGAIFLGGQEVTGLSERERVKRGLGRTFQINSLFRGLSVIDNVALAVAEERGLSGRLFRPASSYQDVRDAAMAQLEQLGLADEASTLLANLPYGKQRLVEMAITLALKPQVLLLDEPAAGVPSLESHRILDVLERLPSQIAILIIEHDMDIVFRFAQRITILVNGATLMEGTPAEIAVDTRVREVYLGERHV
jgi:ABC-type branched-subunit amino acid transport system ATPase component